MQKIIKTDNSHQTATFVILEPNSVDFNWQIISEEEIIKTAHEFMENLTKKYVNINHTEDSKQDDVKYVESFISPVDLVLGDTTIKKGSWLVAFKFSDEKWQQVLNGEIVGVSMEWFWYVD